MVPQNQQQIETALRSVGIHHGMWARSASLQRAASGDSAGTDGMEWVLSTELPAMVFDWERWEFVNEILLADGMMVPAVGKVPLLDSHNRNSAKDVLGHVRDFTAAKTGGYAGRNGKVHFAADADSQVIKQKVEDGHITDGSVGYQVLSSIWVPEGTEVSIDGRLFTGPVKVSRTWSLKEFSITPIGADVLAKVRMLCGTTPRK
ncbi:MAG: hypothetical protein PHZ02_07240 [Desulfocapsaceae bacterium]|nr:hypothetical protein [Desulfocapsaceae bacterium]